MTGSVGHHGRRGCRLLCLLVGQNKPNGSHYYPALLQPLGTHDASCNHPDFDVTDLPRPDPLKYRVDLKKVVTSLTNTEYEAQRLLTGIRKASIFDCLPRILEPPTCFPSDIMHQPVINLTGLMFDLWCGREACHKGDRDSVWDLAVLKGDVWRTHGKAVADAASYFPRSFDRTPRNPAEKLSSGCKAWELLLYFYGLGPGLFYGVLPQKYYLHYCKLVVGIRIIYQRRIARPQLKHAHKLLFEWVLEFELLYYQRKIERLHFVQQCVHSLTHLGPETDRIGPPSLSAQWTMERMIGILGSLINQPSNPFANLTEQAKKIVEVNALVAMWPDLEHPKPTPTVPSTSAADTSYLVLKTRSPTIYLISNKPRFKISTLVSRVPRTSHRVLFIDGDDSKFPTSKSPVPIGKRWCAHLEQRVPIRILRYTNLPNLCLTFINVTLQVLHQGAIRIVEARFYFRADVSGTRETLVLCSLYSPADEQLNRTTHGALNVFEYKGEDALIIIQATAVLSVVTMVPFSERDQRHPARFFLVEKFSLGVVDTGIILD